MDDSNYAYSICYMRIINRGDIIMVLGIEIVVFVLVLGYVLKFHAREVK